MANSPLPLTSAFHNAGAGTLFVNVADALSSVERRELMQLLKSQLLESRVLQADEHTRCARIIVGTPHALHQCVVEGLFNERSFSGLNVIHFDLAAVGEADDQALDLNGTTYAKDLSGVHAPDIEPYPTFAIAGGAAPAFQPLAFGYSQALASTSSLFEFPSEVAVASRYPNGRISEFEIVDVSSLTVVPQEDSSVPTPARRRPRTLRALPAIASVRKLYRRQRLAAARAIQTVRVVGRHATEYGRRASQATPIFVATLTCAALLRLRAARAILSAVTARAWTDISRVVRNGRRSASDYLRRGQWAFRRRATTYGAVTLARLRTTISGTSTVAVRYVAATPRVVGAASADAKIYTQQAVRALSAVVATQSPLILQRIRTIQLTASAWQFESGFSRSPLAAKAVTFMAGVCIGGLAMFGVAALGRDALGREGSSAEKSDTEMRSAASASALVASIKPAPDQAVIARPAVTTTSTPDRGRASRNGVRVGTLASEPASATTVEQGRGGFRGSLSIDSRPSGASIYLNNQSVGRTPLELNDLPVGSRAVRIELEGFESWSAAVNVTTVQRARMVATLTPSPTSISQSIASNPSEGPPR